MSIWTSSSELSHKPLTGPEWIRSITEYAGHLVPAHASLNSELPHGAYALAAAMVYARNGNTAFRDAVIDSLVQLESLGDHGSDTILWAQHLGGFVLAADLIGYDVTSFNTWLLNACETWTTDLGYTLLQISQKYPNHFGAMAFGTLAASYAYLGETTKLTDLRAWFVAGIEGPDPGYTEWNDLGKDSWHLNVIDPRIINPTQYFFSPELGINRDGIIPETQAYAGPFIGVPPEWTRQNWEFVNGAVLGAWVLDRMGNDIWSVGDNALERMIKAIEITWPRLRKSIVALDEYGRQDISRLYMGAYDWVLPVFDNVYGLSLVPYRLRNRLRRLIRGLTPGFWNAGFLGYHFLSDEAQIPTALIATAQSKTVILLTWTGVEDNYDIEGKRSDEETWTISTTSNTESKSIAGLASNTSYVFRVRGVFGSLESDWSDEATETTSYEAPWSVVATVLSHDAIQVDWESNGADNDVEWRPGTGAWSKVTTPNTIIILSSLESDTQYDIRVRAHEDGARYSDYSPEVQATTEEEPPLDIPSNVRVVPLDIDGIRLTWDHTGGGVTFLIERNGGGGWTQVGTSSTQYYTETGLEGGTYNYRVRATDADGDYSEYSDVVLVSIQEQDPGPAPRIIPLTSSDVIPVEGPLSGEFQSVAHIVNDLTDRFSGSVVYRDDDNNKHFERYVFDPMELESDDFYHTVRSGESGRLDLISYDYYRTVHLWWVIANANEIVHPIRDITPGIVLRIPAPERVYAQIMRLR